VSRWNLAYKGVEVLSPEEWNRVVDALEDLDKRVKCGLAKFNGDGSTTTFNIPHGLGAAPASAVVQKAAPDLPDVDYILADDTNITVIFKTPPPSGTENVRLYWAAFKW